MQKKRVGWLSGLRPLGGLIVPVIYGTGDRGQHLRVSWSGFSANIVYYLEVVGVPTVEDGSK